MDASARKRANGARSRLSDAFLCLVVSWSKTEKSLVERKI
jgi:hypothetical protein